ncbi:MAG: polysaccharide biosynthesis tyrosine autokinase [Thiothrix sp.]|nr:polysaccharide biosynthesis tyrosine autokinase [Thiothrix sp.]
MNTLDMMVSNRSNALALHRHPADTIHLSAPEPRSNTPLLSDYWLAWKKNLPRIILFSLLGAALALAVGLLSNKTYTSRSSIKIETDPTRILSYDLDTSRPPSYINDDVYYNTQYKLLRNNDLARKVIAELDLGDYLLNEKPFAEPVYTVLSTVKPFMQQLRSYFPDTGEPQAGGNEEITPEEIFFNNLNINPVRRSRVIDISYTSQDPALSEKVLDSYIRAFIESRNLTRTTSSEEAKDYLKGQIEQAKEKMQQAEAEMLKYAKKNNIVDTNADVSVIASNLALLNEEYIKAKSRRIDAESQFYNKRNISTYLNASADTVIQQKKQQLSSLQAEYNAKLDTFKPAYPEMLQLKRQIDELSAFIKRESGSIHDNTRKNMEANYVASLDEEKKLKAEIDVAEKKLMSFYENSIGYTTLKRDVDTSRNLFEGLLQRMKEISVAAPVQDDRVSVVDSPSLPPRKDGLSYAKMLLIGFSIGFLAASLFVLLREMLSPRIRDLRSLEALAGPYPILSSIPRTRRSRLRNLASSNRYESMNPVIESLRYLRTTLRFGNSEGIPQTLHVTSPNATDGKSTVAIFLAASLVKSGKRVLLIDGDLRKPSIHKKLKLDNEVGLTNYVVHNDIKLHKYCFTDSACFMVISAGPATPDPVDILSSDNFARILAKCKTVFDHIIIDSPPVLGMADSLVLGNFADASLLVVSCNKTQKHDVTKTLERMEQSGIRIAGFVLNRSNPKTSASYCNVKYADGRKMIHAAI